jgi:hypothetical protein
MCATTARTQCSSCQKPGDLNRDGVVNSADLSMVLNAWGTPNGDVNGDGFTGSTDLTVLLNNWG